MKNSLFSLLTKFKLFVLTHKIIVILIVSVICITAVATTSAMLMADNTTVSQASTKESTTEESSTEVTTTEETTVETTTEITTEKPTYKVIPVKNLNIGTDNSVKPVQEAPVNNDSINYALYEIPGIKYGIDVSKWQNLVKANTYADIDWNAIKAAGIDFVMIKCGGRSIDSQNPSLYEDVCYKRNIEGALASGLQVGVYFFSQAITEQEAIEEASYAINLVKGYKITYPIAFDWEGYNNSSYRIYKGYNSFTTTQLNNLSIAFCETIKSAGYTPMHYGNVDSFKNWKFDNSLLSSKYKIWLAQYPSDANLRPPQSLKSVYNYTYQMWQYGSTNALPGIPSGIVDVNIAYFGYSGTEASTTPIKLNITNNTITTNINTQVSLLNGVTASNTIGADVSSSVTVTIKNSSGLTVDEATAFSTPGSYILTYKIVDFTGGSKSANATLIVRGKPVITGIQPGYTASVATSHEEIITLLKTGVNATDYEGNSLTSTIAITGIPEESINAGIYTISYLVNDTSGLASDIYVTTLTIN